MLKSRSASHVAPQVHSMMTKLAQFTDISVALIVGGLSVQVLFHFLLLVH